MLRNYLVSLITKEGTTDYQQLFGDKDTAIKVAFQTIVSMAKDTNEQPQIMFNYAKDEPEELFKEEQVNSMVSKIANDEHNNDEYSVIMFTNDKNGKLDIIIRITPLIVH